MPPRLRAVVLLVGFLLVAHAPAVPAVPPAPDFTAARDEAVETLRGFIQVDTTNPPGNETRGAEYLKRFLDKEGIPSEILALEPARGNLVARIKGSGRRKPILLMGHTDVVGVEREKWSVDPFGGVVKDGYVWGRGASDDKGMTVACLQILLLLHRHRVALDRDVIFLAEAGEESSTYVGIDYMVKRHWDKIECEFALNEGGRIVERQDRVQYVSVATTEKIPRALFLTAKGRSGHGSRPRADNPIVHLAAAVAKIGEWQPPMRLNETTRTFFRGLARISPPEEAGLLASLEDPARAATVQDTLRRAHPGYNAMLRTTLSPNIIKGGFRVNVIPGDASATVDARWMPDEDVDAFMAELKKLIDDPAVEIALAEPGSRKPSAPSRLDTDMFRAITRTQERMFPGAVTLPSMLTGATDSAQLRSKGVQAYGLGTLSADSDSGRAHGNDERIGIAGYGRFIEFLWWTVLDIAAAKAE